MSWTEERIYTIFAIVASCAVHIARQLAVYIIYAARCI
nr:MAG TPA: hypothetical protein [Caudoviricetes sp.]